MKEFLEKFALIHSILIGILLALFFIVSILFASELTIEETKIQLNGDPAKIAEWMGKNIKSVPEEIQYAQSVEHTYKYKKGDCEDWAILSQYFIGDKYETYLVVWIGEYMKDSMDYREGKDNTMCHAVLAIKFYSNNWAIIDNDSLISNGSSLADILKVSCKILWRANIESSYIADMYQYKYQMIKRIKLGE